MAARDDSLFNSEGETWSLWAENIGFSSPNSDFGDDEDNKPPPEKTTTRLSKDEMAIYGCCPRWEDFYLVVCSTCGKAIKPQALRQHIALRHGDDEDIKLETDGSSQSFYSKSNKADSYKSIKFEDKLNIDDAYRENSLSPQDSLSQTSDNQEENITIKLEVQECSQAFSSLNRSSESVATSDYMCMTQEISPLLRIKPDSMEDSFLRGHNSISHRLSQNLISEPISSPHSGTLPSIGPPSSGSMIGPPTPGMGPLTPGVGPPTPGIPRTPTPGMVGPPTPGMGPATPGMGPATPGVGPPTPGMGPPTPGMGPPTPGMAPLTPVMNQVSNVGQIISNHGQVLCPLTPVYSSQGHGMRSLTPLGHPQSMSPLTPSHIPQSPSSVSNIGTATSSHGRPTTPALNALPSNLVPQVSLIGAQSPQVDSLTASYIPVQAFSHLNPEEVRGCVRQSRQSVEEEEVVNRISAMLMKEAEALTAPSYKRDLDCSSLTNSVSSHDIVEATGLAGGGMRRGPLFTNHVAVGSSLSSSLNCKNTPSPTSSPSPQGNSQPMGTIPVPMSSMSMATLKQIQADLLATVSESDLNAVLNATPDTPVFPSNSQSCRNGSTIHYSDRGVGTAEQFVDLSQLNKSGVMHYSSDTMVEQINNSMLVDLNRPQTIQTCTQIVQDQFGRTVQYRDSEAKVSQNDELSRAVDSITKFYREENNPSLESQLAGLLQKPPCASTTSLQTNSFNAGLSSLNTPVSQGITVVIGGGQDSTYAPVSISLTSLAASLNKSSISSAGPLHNQVTNSLNAYGSSSLQAQENILPPAKVTQSNHKVLTTPITQLLQQRSIPQNQSSHFLSTQNYSQVGYQNQTVIPSTPSPKKGGKKKKAGERKMLPLKDREYDPEIHCGVVIKDTGKQCTRSLTCKTHSLTLRRNVDGRSKKFDELLSEHKAAKDAQTKATKPPDASPNLLMQNASPRSSSGIGSGGPSGHMASVSSSPLLVRTLSGTPTAHQDPSPTSTYFQSMEPPSAHLQTTPPSPSYWPSQRLVAPLCHGDNYFVREPPKPVAVCSYNVRRLGGYLATDHKADMLRSALASALKKPIHPIGNGVLFSNGDRFSNVKPLLAKKLQAAIPTNPMSCKEGLGVGVGYNGHIQLSGKGGLINSSMLGPTLKRPAPAKANATVVSNKGRSKRIKPNEGGTINFVGNVVQLDSGMNKNNFPMVTVSLPNGLTNPQTITLGNVPIANVCNSVNQPVRIHPPLTVRDTQLNENRPGDIVLSSGLSSAGFVITDALNPLKNDATGSIRLDGSKIITKGIPGASASTGSISLVGGSSSLAVGSATTISNQTVHQPVYFTTVSGNNNNTQLLQQLLNCRTIGKGTGMKLLGPAQTAVTGNRQAFVLQHDKEPS